METLKNKMIYVEIGETFTTEDGTTLRCELPSCGCANCHFANTGRRNYDKRTKEGCNLMGCNRYACFDSRRPDGKHVIFVLA